MNENKHTSAIIQTDKRRKIRRPGSKKQLRTVLLVFVVIITAVVIAYIIFSPKEQTYTLNSYTSQLVRKSTIRDTLEIPGNVTVRYQTNVLATESGILESVTVAEGDWVQANQVVAVIAAENLEDSLASLNRQLVTQTRNYEKFLLQQQQTLLSASRLRMALTAAVTDAEESLADTRQNHSLGFATKEELDNAEELLADSRVELENFEAEQEISLQLHELDKLDFQDALQLIRDDISSLEKQLAETRVRTPIKGRVVMLIDELAIGVNINKFDFIMQIADTEQPLIQSAIEEQYLSFISEGHPVTVSVGGRSIPGRIEKISLAAQIPGDGGTPTVALEVGIEYRDQVIIPGSSAVVELVLEAIADALVLPRGPYLTSGNRQYLFRITDNQAQKVDITVGAVTESLVQLLSGVSEGDEIITSSYQNYIDYQTVIIGGNK